MINYFLFISGGEIVIVMLFALLFFGSKAIPDIAKTLGKGMREFRKATNEIRREIDYHSSDVKKDFDEVSSALNKKTNEIKKEIENETSGLKNDIDDISNSVSKETNEINKGIQDQVEE
jgi:sec-independent protein translocase protein TatA